jgi:PTS system nitrogen regulatory IIA component
VRHPIVLDVPAPTVTSCFLADPIDLGDGPPVHTFFVLITPSVRSHLIMVSRLAFVVHADAVRAALSRRAPATEVLGAISHAEASSRWPSSQE